MPTPNQWLRESAGTPKLCQHHGAESCRSSSRYQANLGIPPANPQYNWCAEGAQCGMPTNRRFGSQIRFRLPIVANAEAPDKDSSNGIAASVAEWPRSLDHKSTAQTCKPGDQRKTNDPRKHLFYAPHQCCAAARPAGWFNCLVRQ